MASSRHAAVFLEDLEALMGCELFRDAYWCQEQPRGKEIPQPSPASALIQASPLPRAPSYEADPPANSRIAAAGSHPVESGHEYTNPRQNFVYRPLVSPGAIRLLCLLPGSLSEPLRGTLIHATLKKNHAFEALSYTWGDPTRTQSLSLPSGILQITASLHAALTHLRPQKGTGIRVLWIDALCINQFDIDEKATQIVLMARIYSSAASVVAWLGEDEDEGAGKKALLLLERIGLANFSSLTKKKVSVQWMEQQGLPSQNHVLWNYLMKFWRRLWFRRAWVVQEIIKAKDIFLVCGNFNIHWKKIVSGVEMTTEYALLDWGTMFDDRYTEDERTEAHAGTLAFRLILDLKAGSHMGSAISNSIRSFSQRDETSLQELREGNWSRSSIPGIPQLVSSLRGGDSGLVTGVTDFLEEYVAGLIPESQSQIKLPMIFWLTILEQSQATDPRDKLFAYLGLAQDGAHHALAPDYNESVEQVLLRYGRFFIQQNTGMDILYNSGFSERVSVKIPSWIPDWTRQFSRQRLLSLGISTVSSLTYEAASDLPAQIRLSEKSDDEIFIVGSFLGSVKSTLLCPIATVDSRTNSLGFVKILADFFANTDRIFLSHPHYITGESEQSAKWRTLCGNIGGRPHLAEEVVGLEYASCREYVQATQEMISLNMPEQTEGIEMCMNMCTQSPFMQRLLGITSHYLLVEIGDGLVGWMPMDSEVGDEVFLPSGSKMPFCLRRDTETETLWRNVGAGYVHGMMQGEAPKMGNWNEVTVCLR